MGVIIIEIVAVSLRKSGTNVEDVLANHFQTGRKTHTCAILRSGLLSHTRWMKKEREVYKFDLYFLFFILVIYFPHTAELFLQKDFGVAFILSAVHIYFVYLLLKWMSKYDISSPGTYFINDMLSILSIVLIILLLITVTGKTTFSEISGTIFMLFCSIIPPFFWFNFDVIGKLREKILKEEKLKRKKLRGKNKS
ncbi:hypothetical protein [Kroppenstedtia sanguinis]|uniref:Uncharacterized protein n=1 Tax=Kroppenstedtia sanguinis TaxID=1380684 RepID=A0ABW4C6V2_9BACL